MTKAFTELGLNENVLKAVARLGYEEPTPVQERTIPLALNGRDVVATAKTGTGKTAAFGLPIVQLVKARRKKKAPAALIVTPTRELAEQIEGFFETVSKVTHHRVLTVVGGLAYSRQLRKLGQGVDILVATPGRLIDLMERGAADLSQIQMLVLDEADRMLDMGFWPDVEKIVAATPKGRQTVLCSATVDRAVADTVDAELSDPAFVEVAHRGATADQVKQQVMRIPQRQKRNLLRAVLSRRGCLHTIVFVRTRGGCDDVAADLREAGFRAEAIHSDLTQAKRRRVLERFRQGRIGVLVATDVIARGIDVPDVEHVINYDLPDVSEDYIHRIGRTGRAGKKGDALSFVTPRTETILKHIEKLIGRKIPELRLNDLLSLEPLPQPEYDDVPERDGERERHGSSRAGSSAQHARRTAKAQSAEVGSPQKAGGHAKKPLHPAERRAKEREFKAAQARAKGKGTSKAAASGKKGGHRPGGVAAFGEDRLARKKRYW